MFLVKTAFLSRQIICFSLDLLSANILCNVAREKKTPQDAFDRRAHTENTQTCDKDDCRQRGKGVGGCDGTIFP